MKITDILKQNETDRFSIEITPPLKTKSIKRIFSTIDRIKDYNPAFVAVTYHQQDIEKTGNNPHIFQRHASGVGVAAAIKYHYNLEVLPHFICGGFDKFETEDAIFDLWFLGIDNILALRGDPRKSESEFTPKMGGHRYASQLVEQIVQMGRNEFKHSLKPKDKIDFCIGVAAYPEVHKEASSLEMDIKWLKYKIDKGAEYIITQMFFDFELYVSWVKSCRKAGITVPIIPGIKPITQKKHLRRLSQNFGVNIPQEFTDRLNSCKSTQEAYNCGINECVKLSKKLINFGSPLVHYFAMGSGADVADVVKQIY